MNNEYRNINLSVNIGRFSSNIYSSIYCDTTEVINFAIKVSEGKCFYCGLEINNEELGTIPYAYDHFYPATNFNLFTRGNIVLSCRNCNSLKGDKNPLQFMFSNKEKYMRAFSEEVYNNKISEMMNLYKTDHPEFYQFGTKENSPEETNKFFKNNIEPLISKLLLGDNSKEYIGEWSEFIEESREKSIIPLTKYKEEGIKYILSWSSEENKDLLNITDLELFKSVVEDFKGMLLSKNMTVKEINSRLRSFKIIFLNQFPDKECYVDYVVEEIENQINRPITTTRQFLLEKKLTTKNHKDKNHILKLENIYNTDKSFSLLLKLLNETTITNEDLLKYYNSYKNRKSML